MTDASHSGACLCGNVRFEVNGELEAFYLCHCTWCRKDTGSAHAANVFFANARIEWRSGAGNVRTFSLAGTRHAKAFCSVCGSALPYQGEGFVAVPAGSLDIDFTVRPQAHLFVASRAAWDEDLASLPRFDRLPSTSGGT